MSTYLLAFALAAVPYCAYLVGMASLGFVFQRAAVPESNSRRAVWPLVGFSVFAFGMAFWQQTYLSRLFGNWPHNFDIESKAVVGVDIPLALGSGAFDLVGSVFWSLIQLAVIGAVVAALFRPLPDKPLPKRVTKIVLVVLIGVLVLTGWPGLVMALEEWQELF